MLYPQSNAHRQVIELSGFWMLRFDPDDGGIGEGWQSGFAHGRPAAVPASWNDQFEDGRDFLGPAWYQTTFELPWGWHEKRVVLRFGSVNYLADVWLNGGHLGSHEGGHLPFEFEVTSVVSPSANQLVLRVDGRLRFDHVPPGHVTGDPADFFPSHAGNYPQAQFDFFPYCGIHRPVSLYATPHTFLRDITVQTEIAGAKGRVRVRLERAGDASGQARLHLNGHGHHSTLETAFSNALAEADIDVPDATLWSPSNPNLYDLNAELVQDSEVVDSYALKVGVRTVHVTENQLFLNGEPIYLRGFGC